MYLYRRQKELTCKEIKKIKCKSKNNTPNQKKKDTNKI